jgi:hypothetical protein
MPSPTLESVLSLRSVAVIGASDNPHKVGGRHAGPGRMAVRLGEAMLEWNGSVTLIDVNPVIVFETGRGAVAVDASVERLIIPAP